MSGATDTIPQEVTTEQEVPAWKSRLFSWKMAGAVLAFLVVLGWIFIIVVLILEEKWQLVLVAWLLLYSAAHFCYWYCKRHSLITLHRQVRLRSDIDAGKQCLGFHSKKFQRGSLVLFSWKMAGAVLAFLVVLGWIFIIVVLILEEKWQLVLVAWLLLYSAAHFCYWYCKRHSLITLHRQIRLRVLTHMRSGESGAKSEDRPPTYDEVMKTEAPPPAYFTVVTETMKPQSASASSSAAPTYVWTTDSKQTMGDSQASVMEYCEQPPEYNSPKHSMSSSIAPAVHGEPLAFTTAAAISAAAAAVSPFRNAMAAEPVEDPIRGPIVRHLRAATLATLEVSSNEEVTTEASAAAASAPGTSSDSGEGFAELHGPSLRQCTV
ncbi:uncharacterized protein LOC134786125 [Penaeus indicus]|uniref:uncharacterized protein LOC134786125 n=1 Tax=Penaeus indicus TaxID=29960 RepID=UPI00300DA2A8